MTTALPNTLDPFQFAYRTNRSTDDAIALATHTTLSHLEKGNTYVRMLFVDYSSAFNTIVPAKQPWGAPVLRVSEEEVWLRILTTWGLLVRKFRIQMHRGVLRPRLLSFGTSLAGTIVLNAEL